MVDFINRLNKYLTIKNVGLATIVLNLASTILGILYLLIPIYSFLWDIFGVLLLICFFGNMLLVYLNDTKLNKETKLGNRLDLLSYVYLIFFIFGMLLMVGANFLISVAYSNELLDNLATISVILLFYFGILAFGAAIAYIDIKNIDNRELWDPKSESTQKKSPTLRKVLGIILGIICILTLLLGALFAYALIAGVWILGIILPEISLSLAIIFLNTTIILLKLMNKKRRTKLYYGFALIGIIVSGIHIVPLLLTPYTVYSAEANFAEAFGEDWRDEIDSEVEAKYFLQSHYWIPGYFLGIPPKECDYEADVKFFDGSKSIFKEDKDIDLYFDVFWPKEDAKDLPGKTDDGYAIIIKIHGGGWRAGDKGIGHMMQVNKYFAAQGYIVYDIQYGLKEDDDGIDNIIPTPENVLGDFDVDDMMRHIGNFCQYISDGSNKYSAKDLDGDMDYVFVNGGSAGGHLTCTTALAIANGSYTDLFGSNLTIKGMIPFYPANGHSGLEGKEYGEIFDRPEKYLIDKDSPPCLIYQGTHDGSCAPVSEAIKKEYEDANNDECCIIWLPMGGHASDLYFSGYYNIPFLYYFERFLYLCVEDEIT